MLARLFARRYLFSRQSRSVVNLISGLSVAAVSMPVAAMIILLSVFNGFETLVKSMYSAFDADLTAAPRTGQTFVLSQVDTAALARIPGVASFSFLLALENIFYVEPISDLIGPVVSMIVYWTSIQKILKQREEAVRLMHTKKA